MEKLVHRVETFCDRCEEGTYIRKCLSCDKSYCWECWKNLGKEYKHSVHFGGSGDEYICFSCIAEPKQYLLLVVAYQKIMALRQEEKGWYEDFKLRCDAAEAEVKKFRANYGLR